MGRQHTQCNLFLICLTSPPHRDKTLIPTVSKVEMLDALSKIRSYYVGNYERGCALS